MDSPRPLAKSMGVDKALEVLQESGNLIMENIKEGGNGFGRDLQEEALKIFTQWKQIPVAMKGWNFNLQCSCSRTGVISNKFKGVASGAGVNIPKTHPNPSPCARGGVFIQPLPAQAVISSAATKNLLPGCTGMMEGSWVLLASYFGEKKWYFVSLEHFWSCSWMRKIVLRQVWKNKLSFADWNSAKPKKLHSVMGLGCPCKVRLLIFL